MRDIRDDLSERLGAIAAERQRAQEKLAELERQEQVLKTLLAAEEERWSAFQQRSSVFASSYVGATSHEDNHAERTPLARLILEVLAEGKALAARDIGEIVRARGFPFGKKNPGRSVHFALVGMQQHNLVQKAAKGLWKRKEAAMTQ